VEIEPRVDIYFLFWPMHAKYPLYIYHVGKYLINFFALDVFTNEIKVALGVNCPTLIARTFL